ncbi:antistasin-like [Anneissia japonica]|uniref:antistasin-like n=1 Tax=Anneissia japonica TaxID=1529436 RepID=UPI0014256D93|nr:antistasin-like [Anneissia japonica]
MKLIKSALAVTVLSLLLIILPSKSTANPLCPEVSCMIYCEHGHEQDENGCDLCICKANPLCPEVSCMIYCEHGHEQDENGCDLCVCKGKRSRLYV